MNAPLAARWLPIMRFTLTYDGPLSSGGNSSRVQQKWDIRKQISPQLKVLWGSHPALKRALIHRVVPKAEEFIMADAHHSAPETFEPPKVIPPDHIDLCASIEKGAVLFRPLVRKSYALVCALNITFLRNEPVGRVYQGGDLDNRIKTLLDALSVPPHKEHVINASEPHMYTLLEDDALVSSLTVDTRRLLTAPGAKENEVRLLIDVNVAVTDARSYNTLFLGD